MEYVALQCLDIMNNPIQVLRNLLEKDRNQAISSQDRKYLELNNAFAVMERTIATLSSSSQNQINIDAVTPNLSKYLISVIDEHKDRGMSFLERVKTIGHENNLFLRDALLLEWSAVKKVYYIDGSFGDALSKTTNLRVYPELMQHLPYTVMYLDVSGCKDLVDEGIFVKFYTEGDTINIFLDRILTIENWEKLTGEKEDSEYNSKYIDIQAHGWTSKSDVCKDENGHVYVNWNGLDMDMYDSMGNKTKDDFDASDITNSKALTFVLNFLTYLASKEPDIKESDFSQKYHRDFQTPKNKLSQVQSWDVGVRYGNKIRMIEKEQTELVEHAKQKGYRMPPRPHIRCAHWTHVWCGPGKKKLNTRWLEPIYVNGSYEDIVACMNEVTDEEASMYSGERLIHDWLSANEYKHKMQYYVPTIGARYDCCIEVKDRRLFVEYDGEQHFMPVDKFGGVEAYRKQRERDKEKDAWCEEHRYPLLRICYKDKALIPELLLKYIKNPDDFIKKHYRKPVQYVEST